MKEVPHSIEAEQAVLGSLLMNNEAFDNIGDLSAQHFFRADHALIFAQMRELMSSTQSVDMITLYERMAAKGHDQDGDLLTYISTLQFNTPGSENVSRYADIVRDRAVKRGILALSADMAASVHSADAARVLVDRAQSRLEGLASENVKSDPVRAADDLTRYFSKLQDQCEGKVSYTATGFRDVDEKIGGGFRPGEFVVVAGRPAMGKTAFAMNIAMNVAHGGSALILSMEMTIDQLQQRNMSMLGKIHMSRLREPNLMSDEDWGNLTAATAAMAERNLFIDEQGALTMMEVRNKARMIKRKHGLDLLVVDYIGLMTGGPSESRTQEVGSYSRGMKSLAKELGVPIIGLAQLSREVERRADRRPVMADLRDSGEIEQDADAIMFLYRDEVYNPDSMAKGVCEIIIAKQRQGETGTVPLAYLGQYTKFQDLAPGYRIPEQQRQSRGLRGDM